MKSVTIQGVKISVNDPMVPALSKLKGIMWDYNIDTDELVNCCVDNYAISIYEDDATKEGVDFINSLTSDMDANVNFGVKYIKPTAKIRSIKKY